jgi:putative pre-16S rRNA nuclease
LSRILALDYGRARCGCAVSDPSEALATPIDVIDDPASEAGMAKIGQLVAERGVESVVVGLPVSLSGEEGRQAAEVRRFVEELGKLLPVPIMTYDERYTTKLAEGDEGRAPEDSRAAAHLLTSYLRSRETGGQGPPGAGSPSSDATTDPHDARANDPRRR